ncbi:hypothetical protein ACFOW1_12245 [Parasediminibacterium paludis]|uniref:Uncharacterized protein n=1 Tax=Parasediminibacterium paludis TaxID=908966 RepID=A0ABV8Q074_9BACT
MNLILTNPYRILGLLAGASAREQQRQTTRLIQFIGAEQEPDDDFSLPILGKLSRTVSSVEDAASKLNLESDKINAALFWFINGNEITDEPAFDALKDDNPLDALNIWSKLTDVNDVTNKNYSAFINASTYKLKIAFSRVPYVISALEEGIVLKLKFLESDLLNEFVKKIVGITYKPKKEDLQKYFLSQIQFELEKTEQYSFDKFLDIISKIEFSGKEDFLKELAQKPIQQIEKKIDEAREQRKANKAAANDIGISLFQECSVSLAQLKSTLGLSNSKFAAISDKVSEEVLQCGIDYFTYYREKSTDPSNASMSLFRKAKSLAVGSFAKQRCEENTNNLQEWIDEKPERDKLNQIKADLESLVAVFEEFDNKQETIENAQSLINRCRYKLNNIKDVLGNSDELYLKLSTRVASQAQSYIIEEVNRVQDFILKKVQTVYSQHEKRVCFDVLKMKLKEAWDVSNSIGTLDMEYDFRINRYNKNKESLRGLCDQLQVSTSSYSAPSNSGSTSSTNKSSTSQSKTNRQSDFNFGDNAWWILGLVGLVIGAAAGEGGGAVVGAIIGAVIGSKFKD